MNSTRRSFFKYLAGVPAVIGLVAVARKKPVYAEQKQFTNDDEYIDYCIHYDLPIDKANLTLHKSHVVYVYENTKFRIANSKVVVSTAGAVITTRGHANKAYALNFIDCLKITTSKCVLEGCSFTSTNNWSQPSPVLKYGLS